MRSLISTIFAFGLLLTASIADAEWIGLADSSRPEVVEALPAGLDAFSAFGCAECHKNMAEQSYQSGFRVVGEGEEALADKTGQAYSPVADAAKIILGGRAYEQAGDNPALYVLRAHRNIPEAFNSLQKFESADPATQSAVVDYVLMF